MHRFKSILFEPIVNVFGKIIFKFAVNSRTFIHSTRVPFTHMTTIWLTHGKKCRAAIFKRIHNFHQIFHSRIFQQKRQKFSFINTRTSTQNKKKIKKNTHRLLLIIEGMVSLNGCALSETLENNFFDFFACFVFGLVMAFSLALIVGFIATCLTHSYELREISILDATNR